MQSSGSGRSTRGRSSRSVFLVGGLPRTLCLRFLLSEVMEPPEGMPGMWTSDSLFLERSQSEVRKTRLSALACLQSFFKNLPICFPAGACGKSMGTGKQNRKQRDSRALTKLAPQLALTTMRAASLRANLPQRSRAAETSPTTPCLGFLIHTQG